MLSINSCRSESLTRHSTSSSHSNDMPTKPFSLRREAAKREKKPFVCVFVSHSLQLNLRSFDGFLDVLISFSTWFGSALQPVLSPIKNLAVRYSFTFCGNQVELVVLLIAHPMVKGVSLTAEDEDVARDVDVAKVEVA